MNIYIIKSKSKRVQLVNISDVSFCRNKRFQFVNIFDRIKKNFDQKLLTNSENFTHKFLTTLKTSTKNFK